MARQYPFFAATVSALDAVTRLYDFVWPAAASLWNLRWQVAGYQQIRGSTTVEELKARFVDGSGIHGVNLRRACLEHSWEQQQQDLAQVALINIIALYENWTIEIVTELLPSATPASSKIGNWLQFPSSMGNKGQESGVSAAVSLLRGPESAPMKSVVQPLLRAQSKVQHGHLDKLLVVYRFFKECRNCLMHVGGRATERAVEAAANLSALVAKSPPFSIPKHGPVTLGTAVVVSLFGVVGFGDVVQQTMLTVDAELCSSAKAETLLLARWKQEHGSVRLRGDATKRHAAIKNYLARLGLPPLRNAMDLEGVLNAAGLVR